MNNQVAQGVVLGRELVDGSLIEFPICPGVLAILHLQMPGHGAADLRAAKFLRHAKHLFALHQLHEMLYPKLSFQFRTLLRCPPLSG